MIKFVLQRISYGLLVVLGVAVVVFFIFHAMPGDPIDMMVGPRTDKTTRDNIRHELGLDKPLSVQFLHYLNDLSPLGIHKKGPDEQAKYGYYPLTEVSKTHVLALKTPYLRRSFQTNRLVSDILLDALPGTLWLAFAAMFFATIVGIIFGTFAALNHNKATDHLLVGISVLGISTPSFVAAILISMIFGYYLGDYTGLSITGSLWEIDPIYGRELKLRNLILPAFTLGIRPLAIITQLTRSSMLEVLSKDYLRTAKAKGVGSIRLVMKHALKNALNPVITAVSGWLASLMAGAFFIEYIFNWKGIGLKTIQAVHFKDFPVVMGSTLVIASAFIIINIFVDIFYAVIDPRVRLH